MYTIMEDLYFDPVKETKTTLAQEYLNKHKKIQESPKQGRCFVFRNGSDMVDEDLSEHNFHLQLQSGEKVNIDYKTRKKFSEKLKENYDLFCQLEYLIRTNDEEDTKKQLNLILQYLECYDECWDTDCLHYTLLVTDDTPLYCLGYLISAIYCGKRLRLLATKKTTPICYLFYEVCLHAGIDVPLFCINEEDVGNVDKISSKSNGCTVVLTEHADIQSAVDVFLYSSPKAPWRIERLLVQESVYEEALGALSAMGKGQRLEPNRVHYLAAVVTRRGPVMVALGAAASDVVLLATYRTVRDLLALLAAPPAPRFLSLWCADSAQAHEIAAAASARCIWIDGYADFDGPPEAALAIYDAPLFYRSVDPESHAQLQLLSSKWCRQGPEERKSIVMKVMDKFELEGDLLKVYKSIGNWIPKDLAKMDNNKLTIVVDCPEKEVVYFDSDTDILTAIKLIIRGYCVYIKLCSKSTEDLILAMYKESIPIMSRKQVEKIDSDMKVQIKAHHGNKKVTQKTFGTMYAN